MALRIRQHEATIKTDEYGHIQRFVASIIVSVAGLFVFRLTPTAMAPRVAKRSAQTRRTSLSALRLADSRPQVSLQGHTSSLVPFSFTWVKETCVTWCFKAVQVFFYVAKNLAYRHSKLVRLWIKITVSCLIPVYGINRRAAVYCLDDDMVPVCLRQSQTPRTKLGKTVTRVYFIVSCERFHLYKFYSQSSLGGWTSVIYYTGLKPYRNVIYAQQKIKCGQTVIN